MFLVRLGGSCVEEGVFFFLNNLANNSVLVR